MGKSVQSPAVNAWANYSQGEYDTLAGQIDGFMQFNDNPVQTLGESINYFLSDPLRNNPVYGVYQYGKDFKKAVAENDWNTASYKLGVGVINTAEVAASVAIGGKIGGKIPTGKVSVPKVNALSKIGNAIDNFGAPQLAGANGIVISGAVPAEVSVSSGVSAGALGVRAGAVASGTMAAGGVVYASKNSGQSSSKKVKTDYSVSPNGVTEPIGNGQHILERHVGKRDDELWTRLKNNTTITGASTFTDDFSANYVVKQALQDSNNINKINNWLSKGANGNLPLQYKGNDI